jgi:protein SCO1/2
MTRLAALALTFALLAVPAAAQNVGSYGKAPIPGDTGPPAPENVGYDQKLGGRVPLDVELVDHTGRPTTLGRAMGGKPTILVLAYYRCPRLCNEVLDGLLTGLKGAMAQDPNFVAGGPFTVVTVSIDPKESPHLALRKRRSFLDAYDNRPDDAPGWAFLTTSRGQGTDVRDADRKVHRLAEAVGFRYTLRSKGRDYFYQPDDGGWWKTADGRPLGDQVREYDYQHASGVVVLAPDGTITRYLLGIQYTPGDVRSAVADAEGGKVGSPVVEAISQFCFVYDDVKGHYRPTMRLLGVVSAPFAVLVLFLGLRTIRRGMSEKPIVVPRPADPDHPPRS